MLYSFVFALFTVGAHFVRTHGCEILTIGAKKNANVASTPRDSDLPEELLYCE